MDAYQTYLVIQEVVDIIKKLNQITFKKHKKALRELKREGVNIERDFSKIIDAIILRAEKSIRLLQDIVCELEIAEEEESFHGVNLEKIHLTCNQLGKIWESTTTVEVSNKMKKFTAKFEEEKERKGSEFITMERNLVVGIFGITAAEYGIRRLYNHLVHPEEIESNPGLLATNDTIAASKNVDNAMIEVQVFSILAGLALAWAGYKERMLEEDISNMNEFCKSLQEYPDRLNDFEFGFLSASSQLSGLIDDADKNIRHVAAEGSRPRKPATNMIQKIRELKQSMKILGDSARDIRNTRREQEQ